MIHIKGANRHSFIATDTKIGKLAEIGENGEIIWEYDTHGFVFDLAMIYQYNQTTMLL